MNEIVYLLILRTWIREEEGGRKNPARTKTRKNKGKWFSH
jgi:hypothetical protein